MKTTTILDKYLSVLEQKLQCEEAGYESLADFYDTRLDELFDKLTPEEQSYVTREQQELFKTSSEV
jgi:uncharacterized SAM-dependent methyltransferase